MEERFGDVIGPRGKGSVVADFECRTCRLVSCGAVPAVEVASPELVVRLPCSVGCLEEQFSGRASSTRS